MSFSQLSTIILAGGNSKRMKYPKPFLKLEHETFLQKIIGEYGKLIKDKDRIVVVLNKKLAINNEWKDPIDQIKNNCHIVINAFPEKGRLYSLKLGLAVLSENTEFCYIQNADNPFIDERLLLQLYSDRKYDDYTAPVFGNKGGHPILISRKVINTIMAHRRTSASLREILAPFRKHITSTNNKNILININTPE